MQNSPRWEESQSQTGSRCQNELDDFTQSDKFKPSFILIGNSQQSRKLINTHLLVRAEPRGSGWVGRSAWGGCPTGLLADSPLVHLLCSWPKQAQKLRIAAFASPRPPAPPWCLCRSEGGSREGLDEMNAERDQQTFHFFHFTGSEESLHTSQRGWELNGSRGLEKKERKKNLLGVFADQNRCRVEPVVMRNQVTCKIVWQKEGELKKQRDDLICCCLHSKREKHWQLALI